MTHPEPFGQPLAINDLYKSYGTVDVLKDISITLDPGDFLVLVGPSGCGKSTLLNCIAGLEDVTKGSIMIAGRDVTHLAPRDRNIAMVFQSYALYPTMSVRENLAFGMKVRKEAKSEIDKKLSHAASLLQIEPLLDRQPSQLSGGQRQRVAMGRALVRDPDLFLFDEPLSNLDAKLRLDMRAEIKTLHKNTQSTIVYVTHDQVEAMTLATKIVVLKDGKIQQIGSPSEIYNAPENTFVAEFMGSPSMNLVHASIAGDQLSLASDINISLSSAQKAILSERSEITVGFRPEALEAGNDFFVTPHMSEHTGSDLYVMFTLNDRSVTARLDGKQNIENGTIGLQLGNENLCFFDPKTGIRIKN